jgi:hypothetical protein
MSNSYDYISPYLKRPQRSYQQHLRDRVLRRRRSMLGDQMETAERKRSENQKDDVDCLNCGEGNEP